MGDRNPLDPLREAKIALHFLEKEEAAHPINTHQMHLGEHTPKEKRGSVKITLYAHRPAVSTQAEYPPMQLDSLVPTE